jgi:HEPN domain-containing protein
MQEHEKWLQIAKEDLLAAKNLVTVELFSAAVYHCQQSAEKSLKGYLVFKKHEILKTHDLIKLTKLCTELDQRFAKLYETVEHLNPFSSKFRYPSEEDIPDLAEAQLTIKHAQSILSFVIKKIEEPETGQTSVF